MQLLRWLTQMSSPPRTKQASGAWKMTMRRGQRTLFLSKHNLSQLLTRSLYLEVLVVRGAAYLGEPIRRPQMHGQATPYIAPGNCWRAYTNQRPWGSCLACLQWMVCQRLLALWPEEGKSTKGLVGRSSGCPFSAGCCWRGHARHFASDVRYYLHVCEQHARPQHANCSPRGSVVTGAEQVAAHLPPEGRRSRGHLFQLELNHSPCVTVHVKWDKQDNAWPVCLGFFYLPVGRFASPIPSFADVHVLKFPQCCLVLGSPILLEMVGFGDPWTKSGFQAGQRLQEADSISLKLE